MAAFSYASEAIAALFRNENIAGLQVAVWSADTPRHKSPVIIFSHGFHGCNTQSQFLMTALADEGYLVLAPNHKDAACHNLAKWFELPSEAFFDIDSWNDTSFEDRRDDIKTLLDAAQKEPRFASSDWTQVGISGHSLGGYTALGMAGAWPQWKDKRIKAVLAMSPFIIPFVKKHTLDGIEVPVMYQSGTNDFGVTSFIGQKDGAYNQTLSPKIFVEFDKAGHLAWTGMRTKYHATINDYSIAFFDHCLKNKVFHTALPKGKAMVANVRSRM
jgi:predicted dienelactone hydrolase